MSKRITAVLAALVLVAVTAACDRQLISDPVDGAIVAGPDVPVSGVIPADLEPGGVLRVNGVVTTVGADGSWTTTVPSAGGHTTPIEVTYTVGGVTYRHRAATVNGPSIPEGGMSPSGVGMRFTNTGLEGLGPVIEDLAGGAFDIGALLMAQNPIIDQENALLHFDIEGNVYEAGIGGVSLAPVSTPQGVKTSIRISDLFVGVNLLISDGLAINMRCGLELQIPQTTIDANFDLAPQPGAPNFVDVNMVGPPVVDTGDLTYEFISGICDGDSFLIGDIVNGVAGPMVEEMVGEGFASNLGDPDGAGPLDSPIADAIETALADISIAGPVGDAVGATLTAPFTSITETADAIDFRADANFTADPGATPADCPAVEGAPDLASTFDVPGAYPELGATTPDGDPYGLGLVISASAFNQLLGAMTECGLLNQVVDEIELFGLTLPMTSTLLTAVAPEFATALPADTPMYVRVTPTVAPFLTESAGANGEAGELMLANLHIEFVEPRDPALGDHTWLELAVDAPLGFDLGYDPVAGQLAPSITPPDPEDVDVRVVRNWLKTGEANVEEFFPTLFPTFVSAVGDSFGAFPLPAFLGLEIEVLDVARHGNHFVLYANLVPVPQTRIENVTVTDLSSPDGVVDSIFDVNEWRHRIRPTTSNSSVSVAFKGMIGADACCTTDDEDRSAHAGYRVTFDVVPENGDTWQIDVGHLINGAHTLIDERVACEDGGGRTQFSTPIGAKVKVGGGAWQSFDATPSVSSVSHGIHWKCSATEGTSNRSFTGSNATVISGTSAETITVEFGFDLYVKSDSNVAFPAVGGDEVAIRFGANDTITNGFTAGEYPGLGSRSILTDGHFATVQLTVIPAG